VVIVIKSRGLGEAIPFRDSLANKLTRLERGLEICQENPFVSPFPQIPTHKDKDMLPIKRVPKAT
jgi:hypothetical protein